MTLRLTDPERSRLRGMARRPRTRRQLYRAEALLLLDAGRPPDEVARRFRVGVDRVEQWAAGFEEKRLAYLDEPPGFRARARREAPGDGEDE